MLVRLIYPENWQITFRHILNSKNQIEDVIFTTDEVDEADLAVIVNFSPYELKMKAKEVWIFHQEPGLRKHFGHWIKAYKHADRVFGPWGDIKKSECKNFYKESGSLFWGVSGGYDDYAGLKNIEKTLPLSAITSSKTAFSGHKKRLEFLKKLKEEFKGTEFDFEIKGFGISPVKTKDEILMPSKYTLCLENTVQESYFTEKLLDAFLCETMPIYYGAPDIFNYFPKNSLVVLNDLDVAKAKKIINDTIESNLCERNREEILEAKKLVLNKYNFFYNIVSKIKEFDIQNKPPKEIKIPKGRQKKHPFISKIKHLIR